MAELRALVVALLALACWAPAAAASSIHVANADGSERRRLAGTGDDWTPAWSPDGTRIAFAGKRGIHVMAPDGTELRLLARVKDDEGLLGPVMTGPVWSPDGTRIAYVEHRRLLVMRSDGAGRRALANGLNEKFATPSWSPDGTRLTFVRGDIDRSALSVVGADGSGLRTIRRITLDSSEGGTPTWSPDGASIAFVDAPTDRFAVFFVKPDGTGLRRLNRRCMVEPAWAPDATRLACVTWRGLEIVGLDGATRAVLHRDGRRSELRAVRWSPDGTEVSYVLVRGEYDVVPYVIDADGRNRRRLAANVLWPAPAAWSPDGTRIAFAASP